MKTRIIFFDIDYTLFNSHITPDIKQAVSEDFWADLCALLIKLGKKHRTETQFGLLSNKSSSFYDSKQRRITFGDDLVALLLGLDGTSCKLTPYLQYHPKKPSKNLVFLIGNYFSKNDLRKEDFLNNFVKKAMIPREDIWLIDDNEEICDAVRKAGFTVFSSKDIWRNAQGAEISARLKKELMQAAHPNYPLTKYGLRENKVTGPRAADTISTKIKDLKTAIETIDQFKCWVRFHRSHFNMKQIQELKTTLQSSVSFYGGKQNASTSSTNTDSHSSQNQRRRPPAGSVK
ncbi:unnamed protein product [marine sediment metagenome]|uniref:Uncharacterized protein n=1 Tax=marine sediment metagenome TaxID=412755 RepID=X1RY39_9ZZZZ